MSFITLRPYHESHQTSEDFKRMNARKKLNAAYGTGVVITAAFAGALTQSWAVFLFAAVVFTLISVHSGEIRLDKRR